jgi:predicted nucleotidyltransferase component of viral defense system
MSLSRELITRLAAETGFTPETLEKVVRLGEFAADVGRHPLLSRVLVLKGGTALNLFFGPPRRLSVDLDFNYVGRADRDGMLAERPEVERAVVVIAKGRSYRVQESKAEHAGRKLHCGYLSTAGTPDRIEVDLNFLMRVPLSAPTRRPMWQPQSIEQPHVSIAAVEELAIGKLCALLARALPRDLFDALQLPALLGTDWHGSRFRRLFIALAGMLNHPLHSYGAARLDRVTDSLVHEQLGPMLNRSQRVTAAELREQAWQIIEPLLALTDDEREYTDRLQHGELLPELLFAEDPDTAERLRGHPVLRWKAANARGRRERA